MASDDELRGLAAGVLLPGFAGKRAPRWVEDALREGLRGVCIHGENTGTGTQLRTLGQQLRAAGARVIAVDEEGGDVTRVHYRTGSPEPGNCILGRVDSVAQTRVSAARIAAELADLGFTLVLGPVADINSVADNPVIGTRSFGSDAGLVARHTAAWVRGAQEVGIAACAKHFPGHGATSTDSHHTRPIVDVDPVLLRERELAPFRAAIEAGVATVMTSHVVVPSAGPEPATFSSVLLQDVLRGELGFEGAIVSDALDMVGASGDCGIPEASVRALLAGCDLLLLGTSRSSSIYHHVVDAIVAAVRSGTLPLARLESAYARAEVLAAMVGRAGGAGPSTGGATDQQPDRDSLRRWQRSFEVSAAGRQWLDDPRPARLHQVEGVSNPAAGVAPWGPLLLGDRMPGGLTSGAAGGAAGGVADGSADGVANGSADESAHDVKVAVVSRNITPSDPAAVLAEQLRASGVLTVLIDCGWPRMPVDIATYGGSAAVAHALADLCGWVSRG